MRREVHSSEKTHFQIWQQILYAAKSKDLFHLLLILQGSFPMPYESIFRSGLPLAIIKFVFIFFADAADRSKR